MVVTLVNALIARIIIINLFIIIYNIFALLILSIGQSILQHLFKQHIFYSTYDDIYIIFTYLFCSWRDDKGVHISELLIKK